MTTDSNTYPDRYPAPLPGPLAPPTDGRPEYAQVPPHTPEHLAPQPVGPEIPEGRSMAPIASTPPSEFLMSLTGFDEIAIAARFGEPVTSIQRTDAMKAGRALAFTHYRRAGMNDHEAYNAALGLTLREVSEFFPPEPVVASAEGNAPGA